MPNMKHQLFISQACHINKGSILGLGAKRRNKKKSESRQKNKNLKIDQRGGRREGGAVLAELNLISLG